MPRALSSSFVLPTTAAAALVVTATAATAAESSPLTLDLTGQQTAMAQTQQAADVEVESDLAQRRQDAQMQTAALQGRTEAQARAARAAKRKAEATAAAKAKAERESKKWVRPIAGGSVSSLFGYRWGRHHDGVDYAATTGTPLYAMSKGTVVSAGWNGGLGMKVSIQFWDGSVAWYGHMSRIDVYAGQTVMPGQIIGAVGNTGNSTGPHLHLEIQASSTGDSPLNPTPWLHEHGIW